MPPRWPRKPDRKNDPEYRRLDDRMKLCRACGSIYCQQFWLMVFPQLTALTVFLGLFGSPVFGC